MRVTLDVAHFKTKQKKNPNTHMQQCLAAKIHVQAVSIKFAHAFAFIIFDIHRRCCS